MDIKRVDPRLRSAIKKLNSIGYVTDYSCAGHKGEKGSINKGYVSILGKHDKDKMKQVARSVGLERPNVLIRRKKGSPCYRTIIDFKGKGGYSTEGFEGRKSR